MKKTVLLLAALVAISFASCKKDRVCSCTTTSTAPGSSADVETLTYTKSKKRDARLMCMSYANDTHSGDPYTSNRVCTLK